jgi:hypothetical protein
MENVGPCRYSIPGTAPRVWTAGPQTVDRGPWTVNRADGAIGRGPHDEPASGEEVVVTGTNFAVTNPNPTTRPRPLTNGSP